MTLMLLLAMVLVFHIYGCTDEMALNYFAQANTDDGSCIDIVFGCTNPYA